MAGKLPKSAITRRSAILCFVLAALFAVGAAFYPSLYAWILVGVMCFLGLIECVRCVAATSAERIDELERRHAESTPSLAELQRRDEERSEARKSAPPVDIPDPATEYQNRVVRKAKP